MTAKRICWPAKTICRRLWQTNGTFYDHARADGDAPGHCGRYRAANKDGVLSMKFKTFSLTPASRRPITSCAAR